MFGKIVGLVSCLLCAFPFWVIAKYNKDSAEPINFWAGDATLKSKVKNLRDYNMEMAALYQKCAVVFLVNGLCFLLAPMLGMVMIGLDCTLGIWLMYRGYKKILKKYS